ncbi:MAG: FAD-binding protein [Dehalococcoidales bacterium]|nr:FAD-binding protein [Dehalococcoidales bacterium]
MFPNVQPETLSADVLVLGGGAAGLAAAVSAAERNARVLLLAKGSTLSTATALSDVSFEMQGGNGSGFAAPIHPEDSAEQFLSDLLGASFGLGSERHLALVAERSLPMLQYLTGIGVPFALGSDRQLEAYSAAGHGHPRLCFCRGGTGKAISRRLAMRARQLDVTIVHKAQAVKLLITARQVVGCMAVDRSSLQPMTIAAKAVVLATGGASGLFALHTNPPGNTGDGMALAYEAGAELVDLEFQSPMLVALVRGKCHGLSGSALKMGEFYGPTASQIVNDPRFEELVTQPVEAGRLPRGASALWRLRPENLQRFEDHFPHTHRFLSRHGVDLCRDHVPIAHAAHFSLGGVAISPSAATTVPGLFAAGEVSGGFTGAGRILGTGISTGLIFGQVAGANAALRAQATPDSLLREAVHQHRFPATGRRPGWIREATREMIWVLQGVLAHRDQAELEDSLEMLDQVEADLASAANGEEAVFASPELHSLLVVGRGYLQMALMREESRGAHVRDDFRSRNDASFGGSFVMSKGKAVSFRPAVR